MRNYIRFLRRRLMNIGLSREVSQCIALKFQRQIDCRGLEGAVSYLKSAGDALLFSLTGSPQKPEWVQFHKGFPVFFYEARNTNFEALLRLSKMARAIRFTKVTRKQADKVLTAPIQPFTGSSEGIDRMCKFVRLGMSAFNLYPTTVQPTNPRVVGRQFRNVWVAPQTGTSPTITRPALRQSWEIVRNVPELRQLPYWKETFYPLNEIGVDILSAALPFEDQGHSVGTINCAQEGGGKLRMFASPYTVIQCLLYPIHDWFDRFRRWVTTDCSYDQSSGAEWAKHKLQHGVKVHAVDLSTATCRFPLDVQLTMAEDLGLGPEFISVLRWSAKGKWEIRDRQLRKLSGLSELSWIVGQPLGLAPSMSMFSLCHNLLLAGICVTAGVDPTDTFRILGDDVVISNDIVHRLYREVLTECRVPISEHKCFSSTQVSEFAGYTITRDLMIRPGQWRPADQTNFLDLARDLKRPLKGEVTQSELFAQRVVLALEGIGPRGSRETRERLERIFETYVLDSLSEYKTIAPPWYKRICEEYHLQFPGVIDSLPRSTPISVLRLLGWAPPNNDVVSVVFNELPEHLQTDIWKDNAQSFNHIGNLPMVVVFAESAIHNMVVEGFLSPAMAKEVYSNVCNAAHSLLYVVPKKQRFKSSLSRALKDLVQWVDHHMHELQLA